MRQLYQKIIIGGLTISVLTPAIALAGHVGGQGFAPLIDEELSITKQTAKRAVADNIDQVMIRVFARNDQGRPVPDVQVWLTPERFATDTIIPPFAFTNREGVAFFNVRSRLPGVTLYRVEVNRVVIHATPIVRWCAVGDDQCLGTTVPPTGSKETASASTPKQREAFIRNLPDNEALLKCNCHPNVYQLWRDKLYIIPGPAAFKERGFNWEQVQTVSQATLDRFSDHVVIRAANDFRVYELIRQPDRSYRKRWIRTPTELTRKGFNFNEIMVVAPGELALYPEIDRPLLLKSADDDRVYLIENGHRRHVANPAAFTENGFRWQEVQVRPLSQILVYPTAEPLR